MMIGAMRKAMKDESGQALVVGAIVLMILALSVMVTVQLGHAINERMNVQNAADNAAYSTAVVVARSLNFVSWLNRTAITHYVSMMSFQSISSFATGLQTLMWMLADLLQSIAAIACLIEKILEKFLPYTAIPYGIALAAHVACQFAAEGLFAILNSTWSAVNALDEGMAFLVEKLSWINNKGIILLSEATKGLVEAALLLDVMGGFASDVVQKTAGTCNEGAAGTALKAISSVVNTKRYTEIFQKDTSTKIPEGGTINEKSQMSIGSDQTVSTVQKSERMMAELANASRLGTGSYGGGVTWETKRGWDGKGVGKVLKWIGFRYDGSTRLVQPMTPKVFTQGTVGMGNSSDDVAAITNATKDCDQKGTDAKNYCDNTYKPAQAKCDSDSAACASSNDPNSSACMAQASSCSDASSKRSKCDDKNDDANKACNKMADKLSQSTSAKEDAKFKGENYVFGKGADTTQFTRGHALDSVEYVKASGLSFISGGSGRWVGIQSHYSASDSQKSFHCKLKDSANDRHFEVQIMAGCPKYAYTKETECANESGRHKWYAIGKYLSLEPKDDPKEMFNQPTFLGLINKAPDKARLQAELAFGFSKTGAFRWTDYTQGCANQGTTGVAGSKCEQAQTDLQGVNKPGFQQNLGVIQPGLNAWARARTYYHRPGVWSEPPNLFNPFWRAKLSPLVDKNGMLVDGLTLPGQLGNILGKAVTH